MIENFKNLRVWSIFLKLRIKLEVNICLFNSGGIQEGGGTNINKAVKNSNKLLTGTSMLFRKTALLFQFGAHWA